MNTDKQRLIIEYLISSPDVFAITTSIIKPDFFDPEFKSSVKFIQRYYHDYSALPSPPQIHAEIGEQYEVHKITKDQISYCIEEVEAFCKQKAIESAFTEGAKLISKGEHGTVETLIRDALATSVHSSVGMSLFDDPEGMLARLIENQPIPTGYAVLDEYLGGGAYRQQMILLSANSGGGKSILMANMGLNFTQKSLKVLYLTLELSTQLICNRFYSMVSGISSRDLVDRSSEAIISVQDLQSNVGDGDLFIEPMPVGTTSMQIRAFLKEFELKRGFTPDVLIIDYLDLMGANEKVSADNVFEKDKRTSEQFRQILVDYNMIGITASQQNRGAVNATDLNHSVIAGGISKINTTDVSGSIVFNDIFRAKGIIGVYLMKTRVSDGVAKMVLLTWNNTSLRITDRPRNEQDDLEIGKYSQTSQPTKKQSAIPTAAAKYKPPGMQASRLSEMFSDFDNTDIGD